MSTNEPQSGVATAESVFPQPRRQRTHPRRWLAIGLLLCLLSAVVASLIQTNGGRIQVKSLHWETSIGKSLDALLFIPPGADAQHPAPAIVTTHGWYNNKEMQDMNFIEYARRGYVVLDVDMYAHGDSDPINESDVKIHATGLTEAIQLVATLPYVDKSRIGVTGHSNGARAANWAVDDDNKLATPLIKAVFLVANEPTYTDANKAWTNKFGSRDVGVVAAHFDEFFFRATKSDGTTIKPADFIHQVRAQSFLNFGIDPAKGQVREANTIYKQSIDGQEAIRAIYTPQEIHPWNTISATTETHSLEFFNAALGAPNPISPNNQVWQWRELFTTIGLMGFGICLYQFAVLLLDTRFFGSLRARRTPAPQSLARGRSTVWFWMSLALGVIFSIFIYLNIFTWSGKHRPSFLKQPPVYFISLWAVLTGLFAIVLMVLGWYLFGGKASKYNLSDRGIKISWGNAGKTILLALATVAVTYSLVFVADWFFKTDFRYWVLPLKTFTVDKLGQMLLFVPFFIVFYVANSVAINSFNFVQQGKREWVNLLVLAIFNVLPALIMVVVQYWWFFGTGLSFSESVLKPPQSNILGIWLFPTLVFFPAAAVLDRKLFKITKNPYLGGLIMAILVTIVSCANTITILP